VVTIGSACPLAVSSIRSGSPLAASAHSSARDRVVPAERGTTRSPRAWTPATRRAPSRATTRPARGTSGSPSPARASAYPW
jgi:hypothetical protein